MSAREQRTCGNYALVERIAKGGMAEVYLARTTGAFGVDRLVAVKMLLPMRAESKQIVAMFIDEARLAVELTHVNIVQIFELGVSEGRYYIAMEYVPGFDLAEILKRLRASKQTLPITHAVYIAYCVCAALDYAHGHIDSDGAPLNIVHRDISPQNVLIGDEGGVKVADFGIALSNMRLTQTVGTKLKGKVCYMSPEQAWGRKLDARSDLFSVGTILYEMLTGEVPFDGKTELDVVYRVRDCVVKPPRKLRPEIPAELEAIVMRAMRQDPVERFANAAAMHAALEPLLLEEGRPFGARDLRDFVAGLRDDLTEQERRHLDELLAAPGESAPGEAPADWSEIDVTEIIEMELGESAILAVHQPWAAETGLRSVDDDEEDIRAQRAELNRKAQALPQILSEEVDLPEPRAVRSATRDMPRMPTREIEEVIGEVGTDIFDDHVDAGRTGIEMRTGHEPASPPVASALEQGSEEWTVPETDHHRLDLIRRDEAQEQTPAASSKSATALWWAVGGMAALVLLAVVVFRPRREPISQVVVPPPSATADAQVSEPARAGEPESEEVAASRAEVVRLRRGLASLLRGRGLGRGDSADLDDQLVRLAVAVDEEQWAEAYGHAEAAMVIAGELEITPRLVRSKLARMERRARKVEDDSIREGLDVAILEGRALLEEGEIEEANRRLHEAIVAGFAASRGAALPGEPAATGASPAEAPAAESSAGPDEQPAAAESGPDAATDAP